MTPYIKPAPSQSNRHYTSGHGNESSTLAPEKTRSEPLQRTLSHKKRTSTSYRPSEFTIEHVNEVHVSDFLHALACDPLTQPDSGPEHISASSELVPPLRTWKRSNKPKKRKKDEMGTPHGISHTLLKYPLIVSLCIEQ
jgi:hypothetical protein